MPEHCLLLMISGSIDQPKGATSHGQETAARRLGELGDARAVEPLIVILASDEDAMVRASAARALVQIGDAREVAALIAALDDQDEQVSSAAECAC
jgi:HEAT repeat protein